MARWSFEEACGVEVFGLLDDSAEAGAVVGLVLIDFDGDAVSVGQVFDCPAEVSAVDFLDEGDSVAVFPASEAVIATRARVYVERGCAFVVEGA